MLQTIYLVEITISGHPATRKTFHLAPTINVAVNDALLPLGPMQLGETTTIRAMPTRYMVSESAFRSFMADYRGKQSLHQLFDLSLWPTLFPHNEQNPVIDPFTLPAVLAK